MKMPRKQLRITKFVKKGGPVPATGNRSADDEECEELELEICELEKTLRDKQYELFEIQRNSYRRKSVPLKKKEYSFVRPERIVLNNSIESLKRNLELSTMLSGMEVQSYVAGEHCCVVFHMQHDSEHAVKHGLRIEMMSGRNEITSKSFPLGFNLPEVMEDFDNVMSSNCLCTIRGALVAYYDRLEQYQKLKKLVNIEAELFKTLDASHIEMTLFVRGYDEEEDQFSVTLTLDYRVQDVRPKTYAIRDGDFPDNALDLVRQQCHVFKKKPLHRAFREAFITGAGQYKLVSQLGRAMGSPRRRGAPPRARDPHPRHDHTFHPDECSEPSDEE